MKNVVSAVGKSLLVIGLTIGSALVSAQNKPSSVSSNPISPSAVVVGNIVVTGTQTVGAVGSCSRVDINVTGTIAGTVDDGGGIDQVQVELWDDGELKDSVSVPVSVGQTIPFNVNLGFVGTYGVGSAGVGVYVADLPSDNTLASVDPFNPTDITGPCGGGVPYSYVPVPAMSTIAIMVLGGAFAMLAVFGLRRRRRQ